jgi:hypothetical protein
MPDIFVPPDIAASFVAFMDIKALLDAGDKRLCLVVPFGTFTGGQLCLYEMGSALNSSLETS